VPYWRLPWCLRDKTSRIYTKKRMIFFLFQVLYYSDPHKKNSTMTPKKHTKCWWFYVKKKFFFSLLFKKKKLYRFFFVWIWCRLWKMSRSRDLFEIFMMPPNYTHTQILKTKCTIPSVMKKISLSWPHKNNKKKHPFTYLWRDKKNLHTNEEKKRIWNWFLTRYLQWTKILKKLCNEKKLHFFLLILEQCAIFLVDMKNIKNIFGFLIWQQTFWNSEKFDVYYVWYSPEKIHNNKFHEKIFFVKSKDLVIFLTLSGFGVFYLLMGSVTSDFIWIPLLPFHEKIYFFMKIMPTKFSIKKII